MTQPRLLGGRYELDGVVGRGGMAEVYRARDIRLDRIVAIKTLRTDLARDQIFQARFRREAQSAASLNHPSIVAVYDTGEDMTSGVPVPYIVMEYVDGRTVRDLLQEGHRLLPERSLEIIDGVLRALDYSHQAGIVHRDIKPGNVMVTRNGDIKVMDFGIARAMSDAQATMTQTAQVIGTAQYLSPEQARGERVDSRSDLYSTGCLLYELLTGRPPFTGDSPVAIAYQHVRENPVPPSRVDPDVPPWADAIVLKAMAKAPADRYQTAADMRADLQRAASGMPVAAAPPTRFDMYPQTQRMGTGTMMAGATSQIPPVEDYDYAGRDYDYAGRGGGGGGTSRRWIPWVLGVVLVIAVVGGVAYYLLAGAGKTYAVPLVNGEPVATAQAQIKAAAPALDGGLPELQQRQGEHSHQLQPCRREQRPGEHPGDAVRLQGTGTGRRAERGGPAAGSGRDHPAVQGLQGRYQDRRHLVFPGRPGDQPEPERRHGRARRHGHDHRVRRSGLRAVGGRGFAADRQPGPDHGRLPGQRPAGVGPGAVRQRHGLQQKPGQRHRDEGLHGHHLRAERAVAERAADRHGLAHRDPERPGQQHRDLRPQPVKPEESIGR